MVMGAPARGPNAVRFVAKAACVRTLLSPGLDLVTDSSRGLVFVLQRDAIVEIVFRCRRLRSITVPRRASISLCPVSDKQWY